MQVLKNGISVIGKLALVLALAVTFAVGMLSVFYLQLKGEEVTIPKIVGKNFNDGRDDLADFGLRIRRIASRYSNEDPDTILEQRPRAGTIAKSGLMISVVVSEKNPDGSEAPVELKDDDEAIKEIEQQPELKIDKPKAKVKPKKTEPKTRDVLTVEPEAGDKEKTSPVEGTGKETGGGESTPTKPADPKTPPAAPKPPPSKPSGDEKRETNKPKPSGDLRDRKVKKDN